MNAPIEQEIIGLGHNRPPLKDMLATSYADLVSEIAEATSSAGRAPEKVDSAEVCGKVADLISDLRKLKKQATDAHDTEKSPFLTAGRDVDDFFRTPIADTDTAIKALLAKNTVYLQAVEDAAKAEAKRIEDEARAESERKLLEAEKAQDKGDFDAANVALTQAAKAEDAASNANDVLRTKPADLTRVYSSGGSVTSLRKEWVGEILDADKLDAAKLFPYIALAEKQKALRAFVKAGGRELAGARIFEQGKAR